MSNCKFCGASTLIKDETLGHIICTSCGSISQENITVSALSFTEQNGTSALTGQLINLAGPQTFHKQIHNNNQISNLFESLCMTCSLPQSFAVPAFRWYKLSLQYNLTKGRPILYTLSAFLYIVCRLEKTAHMIVDFSAALRIDATKIGKIYLKIIKKLNIKINSVDPSLYIHRYIKQLEMDNDKNIFNPFKLNKKETDFNVNIDMLANRIVRWMKRDWIVSGRRPNNICGAAIYIAGRIIGKDKSIEEIARVVKASTISIVKRIKEVSETETANMTIEEFMRIWIEKEEDPPVIKKRRKIINPDILMKRIDDVDAKMNKFEFNEKENHEVYEVNVSKVLATPLSLQPIQEQEIEDNYDFENDSEIENCILDENETKKREEIWNEMYEEFLKEKENRVPIKKVKKIRKKGKKEEVQEKKKTDKLNYGALNNFFD